MAPTIRDTHDKELRGARLTAPFCGKHVPVVHGSCSRHDEDNRLHIFCSWVENDMLDRLTPVFASHGRDGMRGFIVEFHILPSLLLWGSRPGGLPVVVII